MDGNKVGHNTGATLAVRLAKGSVGELVKSKGAFVVTAMGVSNTTDGCQGVPEDTHGHTMGKAKLAVMF